MELNAKNTGRLLMICGALYDLAEFNNPRPEQIKQIAQKMEKIIKENILGYKFVRLTKEIKHPKLTRRVFQCQ